MNKEELKQQLIDWCHEQGEWQAKEDSVESGTDFVLILRSQAPPAVVLEVKKGSGEDWITLHHALKISKASVDGPPSSAVQTESFPFEEMVKNLIDLRAALLRGEVEPRGENYLVSLTCPIYLDGLSKHIFLSILEEIVKTRRLLEKLLDEIRQQREALAKLQESLESIEAKHMRMTEDIKEQQSAAIQPAGLPVDGRGGAAPLHVDDSRPRCMRCGESLPEDASFCARCGNRVSADASVPSPPVPSVPMERHCSRCGQIVRAGKAFCTTCGAPVA